MAQVTEDRTRALSASTFRGKRAELLPDSKLERLSGIPLALVYLGFLGDPNRFTVNMASPHWFPFRAVLGASIVLKKAF